MSIWLVTFWLQLKRALGRGLFTRRALLLVAGAGLLLTIQAIILYKRKNPHLLNGIFVGFHCWATISIMLPIAAMYQGVTSLLEDTERGSIAYLFSRPAPRSAILSGRVAGASLVSIFFSVAVIFLSLALTQSLGKAELLPVQGPAFFKAATAIAICFTCLGACLGAFTTKGMLWGIGAVTGGELVMGGMLANAQMTGFRSLLATDMARQAVLADVWPQLTTETKTRLARDLPVIPEGLESIDLYLDMGRYGLIVLLISLCLFCFKEQRYKTAGS